MEIYLIRHTTPQVPPNTCYGQADIDLQSSFIDEVEQVRQKITAIPDAIWSSPLKRCRLLAERLFPGVEVVFDDDLKEINCGDWEMKSWDDIPKHELEHWMKNYKTHPYPGGENYLVFQQRVLSALERIYARKYSRVAIVTHSGVIRTIMAALMNTSIDEVLSNYKLKYGCVVEFKDSPVSQHANVY